MKSCFMKISFSPHIYKCSCHKAYIRIESEQTPTPSRPSGSIGIATRVPCALGTVHDFPDVYNAIPWISLCWVAGASARLNRPPKGVKQPARLPSQPFCCDQNFLAVPYLIARRRKEARRRRRSILLAKRKPSSSLPCLLPSAPRSSRSSRADERADDNPQTNELEAFQTPTCAPHCLDPCSRAVRFW